MRIISGVNKGMKLLSPAGDAVRPTIDRIKEAAFNIMQFELENGRFLDMFSGSGQMGIEALARGCNEAWFFDPDKASMAVIKSNITKTGFGDRAVVKQSSYQALRTVSPKPIFNLAYIDPPFGMNMFEEALTFLIDNEFMAPSGIIIVETPKGTVLPEKVGKFENRVKSYGQISLNIYKVREEI